MLSAGARGYLLKDCAVEELVGAIRSVAADMVYLSPAVAAGVVRASMESVPGGTRHGLAALTPRQREVLQLIAEGLTTKQIAARMHLSTKTVETHRQQLMAKLNLTSVAELVRYAIREGVVTLE
jgi:DNA-binding NarL/FixJ family response regulator